VSLAVGEPVTAQPEPGHDCPICPRLAAFRETWRRAEPAWHNAPVQTFGKDDARLLIVGLAPGLRGANRTGRPFTGDYAGDLLYRTMIDFGFATGTYAARPDDGLSLVDATIANAVRCVPPENKPLPQEIANCRQFLAATLGAMPQVRAIIALGRIAHDSVVAALGQRRASFPFAHGAEHEAPSGIRLYDSYHCSRYNTNTGVLTEVMFRAVFARVRMRLAALVDGAG
jgi:uracil-DNA glycosylase family 4